MSELGKGWHLSTKEISRFSFENSPLHLVEKLAGIGHWYVSIPDSKVYWSDQVYRIHGRDKQTFQPDIQSGIDAYHSDDREMIKAHLDAAIAEKSGFEFEHRLVRPDGSIREVNSVGECELDSTGQVIGIFGIFQDITDRKRAEQNLAETKDFYRAILDNVPDMVFVKDSELRIIEGNKAFWNMYDQPPEDLMGTTTFEKFSKDQAEGFMERDYRILQGNEIIEINEEITDTKQRTRIFNTKKIPFDSDLYGRVLLGDARDVSGLLEVQEALRETKERYDLAVRGSGVGIWDWNVKTNELFWSDRFKEIMGISEKDFVPTFETFANRLHPDDKDKILAQLDAHVKSGDPYDVEYRLKRDDGHYIWINAAGQALWDEVGNATRMAGSVEDIDDRKIAEAQREDLMKKLTRSNEELERFAYVASHDLQEPIRMVASFATLLQKRYSDKLDDDADEFIRFIVEGAERMHSLVDDILEYSRVGREAERLETFSTEFELEHVKDNLADILRTSGAEIKYKNLPIIHYNPAQFLRLMQNLIGNGIKYQQNDKLAKIEIWAENEGNDWVFAVKDNGIGIMREYWSKIFHPFQKLHARHEYMGTGIGLAICKKIVEQNGGRIWVESEVDSGTTFYFSVPKNVE